MPGFIPVQKESQPQVFRPQDSSPFPPKLRIVIAVLIFLILVLLGFNLVLARWQNFSQ